MIYLLWKKVTLKWLSERMYIHSYTWLQPRLWFHLTRLQTGDTQAHKKNEDIFTLSRSKVSVRIFHCHLYAITTIVRRYKSSRSPTHLLTCRVIKSGTRTSSERTTTFQYLAKTKTWRGECDIIPAREVCVCVCVWVWVDGGGAEVEALHGECFQI